MDREEELLEPLPFQPEQVCSRHVDLPVSSPRSTTLSNRVNSLAMNPLTNARCDIPAVPFDRDNSLVFPWVSDPDMSAAAQETMSVSLQMDPWDARTSAVSHSSGEGDNLTAMPTPTKPYPETFKRATSHLNETRETRPGLDGNSVKRSFPHREGSLASSRLKKQYVPGYFDDPKGELDQITSNLSSISAKPDARRMSERLTTLDMSALSLAIQPIALGSTSRSNTIEALNIDFDDDHLDKASIVTSASLGLKTKDLIDIVNV